MEKHVLGGATDGLMTGRCASQDVKARGVRVDKALLNALISALGSAGLAQEALAIFRTMVSTIE